MLFSFCFCFCFGLVLFLCLHLVLMVTLCIDPIQFSFFVSHCHYGQYCHFFKFGEFAQCNCLLLINDLARAIWRWTENLKKHPLEQKRPLTLANVQFLETLCHQLPNSMILGQLLFCIHSCCRWKMSNVFKGSGREGAWGDAFHEPDSESSVASECRQSVDLLRRLTGQQFGPYLSFSRFRWSA